ncbi:MAG: hypothetical protein BWZ10_02441 [candidate division BRC1 bacterium ADurb.BinA364]|nr:MAG: hypothetical protein BWZ10_02441 [candidate division BRC1 bacterium ADurb.BinA364]
MLQHDRLAFGAIGPERFSEPLPVALDDLAGDGQNRFRRTVILLQAHDSGVGERLGKIQQVFDIGAAPGIDRLVLVAHDAQVASIAGHQLGQAELGQVGVLVFVNQQVLVAALDFLSRLAVVGKQFDAFQQQIVEIQRVVGRQFAFVFLVDGGKLIGLGAGEKLLGGAWPQQMDFGLADAMLRLARRHAFGVDVEPLHAFFDQPALIRFVEDRIAVGAADFFRLAPQQRGAKGVKCRNRKLRLHRGAEQPQHAIAHLARRFVGEGGGEDAPWLDAFAGDEAGDAVRDHARLARSGSGDDEQRPASPFHRFALRRIQIVQQMIHGKNPGKQGPRMKAHGKRPKKTAAAWIAPAFCLSPLKRRENCAANPFPAWSECSPDGTARLRPDEFCAAGP